jgi:hypothetical protein
MDSKKKIANYLFEHNSLQKLYLIIHNRLLIGESSYFLTNTCLVLSYI